MSNVDQAEFWNAAAGRSWVALQGQMDALMQPVLDTLLDAAALRPGARVLDIGCGTGASVVQAAAAVGRDGHVTGLDIADTMLDLARSRVADHPNTTVLRADAQHHTFEQAAFDTLISRFGVMFFDDTLAALRNLAHALAVDGSLTFATWGPARDNPFFMMPAAAAARVLGPMPKVDRTLPGPFAFEDTARVTNMMRDAGLHHVTARRVDIMLTPQGDLAEVAALCCRIGPANAALTHHDASAIDRTRLMDAITRDLTPFATPDGVRIPAAINIYTARKSA